MTNDNEEELKKLQREAFERLVESKDTEAELSEIIKEAFVSGKISAERFNI